MTDPVPPGVPGGPGPSGVVAEVQQQPTPPSTADLVATAVLAVDGVARLDGGTLGGLATYLPGRRVAGVRLAEDVAEIGVAVHYGSSVAAVAGDVRRVVGPLVGTPVAVVVQDVLSPAEASAAAAPAAETLTGPADPGPELRSATDDAGSGPGDRAG